MREVTRGTEAIGRIIVGPFLRKSCWNINYGFYSKLIWSLFITHTHTKQYSY